MVKKIKNPSFAIILCLAVLVLATAFFSTGCLDLSSLVNGGEEEAGETKELQKEELSSDQEKILSVFGYPDEFIIVFDQDNDNTRIETWLFEDMEVSYTFTGGKYNSSSRVITDGLLSDDYEVGPEDFVHSMRPEDINYLLGEKGIEEVDTDTNLKIITYGEGLIVCTFDADDAFLNILRARRIRSD